MNKIFKTVICLLLCLSVILSLSSCVITYSKEDGLLLKTLRIKKRPEGYTGGIMSNEDSPQMYRGATFYWVETYEEALAAINSLTENGSRIYKKFISSYENDVVDAKYLFILYGKIEKIGHEWYDKKYRVVEVKYFGFIEDVSIDKLEYSHFSDYKCVSLGGTFIDQYDPNKTLISECGGKLYENSDDEIVYSQENRSCRFVHDAGKFAIEMMYYNTIDHREEYPENFHEDFLKSLIMVGE